MQPDQGSTPLPPVSSQHGNHTPAAADGRLAPPFTGGRSIIGDTASPNPPVSALQPDAMPWDDGADEGTVEPVFEEDVHETEAQLAALSQAGPRDDAEFPMDAFIIPEHTSRLPTGLDAQAGPSEQEHTPTTDLAERLEKLSHRMRVEDVNTIIGRLAAGDALDAMLAGLLAGYLSRGK